MGSTPKGSQPGEERAMQPPRDEELRKTRTLGNSSLWARHLKPEVFCFPHSSLLANLKNTIDKKMYVNMHSWKN